MTDGTDMEPGPSGSQLEPHFHHPVLTYLLNSIDYHSYSHPKTNDAIYFCVAKVGFPVGGFRAQVVEHMDESPELQLESSWEFRWRFWEIGTNMTEKIDPLRKRACLQWWRVSCWLYTVRVELLTVLLVLTSVTNIRTITMAVVFIENLSLMPQLLETPPHHPSFDAIAPWGFKFNTWNFLRYHQFLESCQGFSGPICYGFFLVCCSRFTNSTEFLVSTLHLTFCPNGSLYNSSYVFVFQKDIVDPTLLGGCWEERDSWTHLPTTGALTLSIQHP